MSDILHAGPEDEAPQPVAAPAVEPPVAAPAPTGSWSPPAAGEVLTDSRGRQLTLRAELSFLDEMDLRSLAGSQRDDGTWFTLVIMASRVADIDGVPIRFPKSEVLLRAMLQMVDRSGIAALVARFVPPEDDGAVSTTEESQAKN